MGHRTRWAGAALAVAAAVVLAGCGGGGDDDADAAEAARAAGEPGEAAAAEDRPVITVLGEGRAEGRPDLMTVQLGVETRAATADEALADNNARAAQLIEVLKQAGVESRDLQTSDLSVYPNFDEDGRVIVGYTVANILTASLRDLDGAGALIDAAAAAVGDAVRLHGVSFSIEDTDRLAAAARTEAVERAARQARQLADAAGVTLGPIRSIDEVSAVPPEPLFVEETAALRASADAGAPIERGTEEVSLTVRVVYEIAQD